MDQTKEANFLAHHLTGFFWTKRERSRAYTGSYESKNNCNHDRTTEDKKWVSIFNGTDYQSALEGVKAPKIRVFLDASELED